MRVMDLSPGMQFRDTLVPGNLNTFVAQCPHPLYKGLRLVIWRMHDSTTCLDALSAIQEITSPLIPSTVLERRANLQKALVGAGIRDTRNSGGW